MLVNFRSLVQAEVFADFLDMAEHLLGETYKDAAAVLLGAVLEDSLRKIAGAKGVDILNSKGKPLTIDPLNVTACQERACITLWFKSKLHPGQIFGMTRRTGISINMTLPTFSKCCSLYRIFVRII